MEANEFKNTIFHTAIIGAGASGLFCAGSFNARKIVLEAGEDIVADYLPSVEPLYGTDA